MTQKKANYPLVGVIMGSTSDWETMREACEVLDELNVSYEKRVVSAHRTPEWMSAYATLCSTTHWGSIYLPKRNALPTF